MRRALALLSFVVACSGSTAKVDPSLVGSWELMVPNAQGTARWVWDIRADGTYGFHAEGPGNIPAHSGVFEARSGTLRAALHDSRGSTRAHIRFRPATPATRPGSWGARRGHA